MRIVCFSTYAIDLQSQLPCALAMGAMNNIQSGTAEGNALLVKQARLAFISELAAIGGSKVAFGGSLLPRKSWSRSLALAMVEARAIQPTQADAVMVILDSDLGNASQLSANLVKEGAIVVQGAAQAAESLADVLAKRAAAKS